jgi:hypothetical protein
MIRYEPHESSVVNSAGQFFVNKRNFGKKAEIWIDELKVSEVEIDKSKIYVGRDFVGKEVEIYFVKHLM